MTSNLSARVVFAIAAALGAAGCGGDIPRASVSGTVTLNGGALKDPVLVNFVGVDNLPLSATSDAAGNYSLPGVAVGPVKVTVNPVGGGVQAQKGGGRAKDNGPVVGRPAVAPKQTIPAEYQDPAKPLFTLEVKPGSNVFPLDIKSPAPK